MKTLSVASAPGKKEICGFRGAAVQGADAEQAARAVPLGSGIMERPAPPDSARYMSTPKKSMALTPRPSLVLATRVTAGDPDVVIIAPATFMMSPDLR